MAIFSSAFWGLTQLTKLSVTIAMVAPRHPQPLPSPGETPPTAISRRAYRRPATPPFRSAERHRVTLLFGGLTTAHDRLIEAVLSGLGYRAERLPLPDKTDFHCGREHCNSGLCNPIYFVCGALIRHLEQLRERHQMTPEEIVAHYLFVTPGSCGPCRFGMYEATYRQALEKAGYTGFRVLTFDKKAGGDGHASSNSDDGLVFDVKLYLALFNAILLGDQLNALLYRSRPYARDNDRLEATFEACLKACETALHDKDHTVRVGVFARLLHPLTPLRKAEDVARLLAQMRDNDYVAALQQCRSLIESQIELEPYRPKPVVRITGEFWAQTTEGAGNFHMFRFLEEEGAEVHVEPVATWIDYMRHSLHWQIDDRRSIAEDEAILQRRPWRRLRALLSHTIDSTLLRLSGWLLHREYNRLRSALGDVPPALTDQRHLEALGHRYHHARITGGEGYLEVAKNLHAHYHRQAHLVLSLKPFGCMPSTQSDGAQAAVLADHEQIRFLPIETAGEGEIHAYSRVQMALSEAKSACREEVDAALVACGASLQDLRAEVDARPELRSPFYPLPSTPFAISRSARLIRHIGARIAPESTAEGTGGDE